MSGAGKKVVVVPCSGIGKSFGSVAREAGYDLVEDLRPEKTLLVALAKLVMGDEDARKAVAACPAVTIDGCKLNCAAKTVRENGGQVVKEVAVQEVYRRHKALKPEGVAALNPAGCALARALADELVPVVDAITAADASEKPHA
ncbi:MAG: hypothetical protein NTZ26_02080 [Candidatus Aminicenantes bacterium]|nr:hypothetical protein [Candidatus Aminicenantes bacterium]